jgi:beta-phosphoglucomutase
MPIRGIVFDFNGVLIDDEGAHFHGFQQALKETGLTLSWEEYCRDYLPYDDRNFFLHFLYNQKRQSDPQSIRRLIDLKSAHYFKAIEQRVPTIEPTVDFVRQLSPTLPLAIASGAARKEIESILDQLKLRERFATIISAEDVVRGKPHPETFLKALAGLKEEDPSIETHQVLVIEDSYRGVQSVHDTGMKCLALTTTYSSEQLGEADLVLETLQGWTLERLEEELGK